MEFTRCKWADKSAELSLYHDREYGVRVSGDVKYFERLILEIFQAGLSWGTILKKRENFNRAFDNFNFYKIAAYDEKKIGTLMNDPGIIRNRRKIEAAVYNAGRFVEIVGEHSSFDSFMTKLSVNDRDEVLRIFRKNFRFMGPLIVEEFMMSVGFWKVKHEKTCFMFNEN